MYRMSKFLSKSIINHTETNQTLDTLPKKNTFKVSRLLDYKGIHIHCISSHLLNHFLHPWVSQSNHHSQRWQNSLPFCVDLCLSGHHLTSYFASSTFSCHLWLVLTISFSLVLCFQVVDFSDLKISPCSSFLATDGAFRVFLVFCWHPL